MGGSFNPVHIGHLMLASYIRREYGLDSVKLVLSPLNPLKENPSSLLPDDVRLHMLRFACSEVDFLEASDVELELPRPSYTINTLRHLSAMYPDTDFFLIIGADNWQIFDKWRDYRKIIDEYGVVIYPRMGYEIDETSLPANVRYLRDAPVVEISSTFIRQAIGRGDNMEFFMPDDVYGYIKEHHLYEQ